MKNKTYTYGVFSVVDYVGVGMILVAAGPFLSSCGAWIAEVIQGDFSTPVLVWEFILVFFAVIVIIAVLIFIPLINLFSKFMITDEGIHVRIFNYWFFWKFIPWEKVKSFEPSSKGDHLWLLRVDEELTIWHRTLARMYSPEEDSVIVALRTLQSWSGFKARVKKYLDEKDELVG